MKRSILKSLILGGLCVVMLSFIIAGSFFFSLLTDSAIDEKIETLKQNVPKISELSSIAISSNSTPIMSIYRSVIDSITANTEASIIVFDKSGTIVTVSGLNKSTYIGAPMNEYLAKPILKGEEYHKTGLLDDFFNEPTLTVGSPMYNNGEIFGGVVFNMPIPEIRSMNWQIFKNFVSMSLVALCFSVVLYYFISKRITKPIKNMSNAVTEFAKGNFERRVEYKGEDEIGELATNFNVMATSLENLENMRSTFVANVSHELRTPMTTIAGFIEGILDGTISKDEQDKYLKIALDETKRLSRLVNDLLSISKMENGEFQLNKSTFNINELVAQSLFKFESNINDKNIEVELNLSDDVLDVYADNDAITQIVTNLLHNAVKFTPADGNIWIRTWLTGKKAYVEIKNSGHGIESDKLKFIFDRFYKTDDSRSSDKNGVGLGLFIVKNLLNHHGEKIWVESETDKYTKFVFSLTVA
ncbi:MAG: HAMP domain-containing protein [Clostridia bacterium]|nr:HAMP domain-containing protein [Clostridia bacterium]